jgi:hypothetical protein
LGRGRRNKRRYLRRDHRGYVRGSDQLGDGGGRRGAHGKRPKNVHCQQLLSSRNKPWPLARTGAEHQRRTGPNRHRPFIRTLPGTPFVPRAPLQRRADIEAQAQGRPGDLASVRLARF